jgi:hypothetical protein
LTAHGFLTRSWTPSYDNQLLGQFTDFCINLLGRERMDASLIAKLCECLLPKLRERSLADPHAATI